MGLRPHYQFHVQARNRKLLAHTGVRFLFTSLFARARARTQSCPLVLDFACVSLLSLTVIALHLSVLFIRGCANKVCVAISLVVTTETGLMNYAAIFEWKVYSLKISFRLFRKKWLKFNNRQQSVTHQFCGIYTQLFLLRIWAQSLRRDFKIVAIYISPPHSRALLPVPRTNVVALYLTLCYTSSITMHSFH